MGAKPVVVATRKARLLIVHQLVEQKTLNSSTQAITAKTLPSNVIKDYWSNKCPDFALKNYLSLAIPQCQ